MRRLLLLGLCMTAILAGFVLAGKQLTGSVEVTMVSQEPDPAYPGGYVELRFKAENLGDYIKDVEFEILPEYPFTLDPDDSPLRKVGTIYGRQQGDDAMIIYYRLKVDNAAVEGTSEVRLRYRIGADDAWRRLDPFTVRVRTTDSILSVISVVSEPEVIEPGKVALITIKLKNQADSLIKDLHIKWDPLKITSSFYRRVADAGTSSFLSTPALEELPFTPIGSTNEKIIYMLDSKEEIEVPFKIMVSPDAPSRDYKVELDVTYNDELGNSYSLSNNVIGLVVGNTPDLSTTLETSSLNVAGKTGDITVKVVNQDVMDIKFVTVQLKERDCYKIISPNKVYVGNIDTDDYETADFTLYVEDKECNKIPALVTYKDANNNEYSKEVELELPLYSKSEARKLGLTKTNNILVLVILIIIIIAGLVTWRYYRRRRAARR